MPIWNLGHFCFIPTDSSKLTLKCLPVALCTGSEAVVALGGDTGGAVRLPAGELEVFCCAGVLGLLTGEGPRYTEANTAAIATAAAIPIAADFFTPSRG